jgi:hypothetical protein
MWRTRLAAWWSAQAPRRNQCAVLWVSHFGRPALLALALLALALLLRWQITPEQQREHGRLATRLALLPKAFPPAATETLPAGFAGLQELPSERERAGDLETLVTVAERNGLALDRADYALANAGSADVLRVTANLPLSGTYTAVRQYVADVLNDLPHAALESLQIERANAKATQLQATARLTLYYRADQP